MSTSPDDAAGLGAARLLSALRPSDMVRDPMACTALILKEVWEGQARQASYEAVLREHIERVRELIEQVHAIKAQTLEQQQAAQALDERLADLVKRETRHAARELALRRREAILEEFDRMGFWSMLRMALRRLMG